MINVGRGRDPKSQVLKIGAVQHTRSVQNVTWTDRKLLDIC